MNSRGRQWADPARHCHSGSIPADQTHTPAGFQHEKQSPAMSPHADSPDQFGDLMTQEGYGGSQGAALDCTDVRYEFENWP
jgi:hypothetical protein